LLYGSSKPPSYNLTLVTAKTFIFVGENDDISTWPDAQQLAQVLPNVARIELLKFRGKLIIIGLDFIRSKLGVVVLEIKNLRTENNNL